MPESRLTSIRLRRLSGIDDFMDELMAKHLELDTDNVRLLEANRAKANLEESQSIQAGSGRHRVRARLLPL